MAKPNNTKKILLASTIVLLLGIGVYLYLTNKPKTPKKALQDVFDNLVFETGKDVIKPSSFEYLDKLVEVLLAEPTWKIQIIGHTDSVGNDTYNLNLSNKRADAVKKYLISKNISENLITSIGKGETMPIADNKTVDGRLKNRRVEFIIMKPNNSTISTTK